MLEINTITTDDEFKNIRTEWNELLGRSNADNPFLTWEWLWTWWEVFKKGGTLHILTARERGKLLGCAPLYLSKKSFLYILSVRQMEFLGTGRVCSDHLDFILFPGREREVLIALLKSIEEGRGEVWDILCLSDMPEDSISVGLLNELGYKNNFFRRAGNSTTCPYISLPGDFETFLSSLSKQFRKEIRKDRRRLEKLGKVELHYVTQEAELPGAMDEFIKLHQSRWQSTGESGVFYSKNFTEFHKRIAHIFLKNDWLELVFLKVDDNIVACRYYFTYNNRVFAYQGGYDINWAKHSVGLVIISYCIENAIAKGIKEYDFLRGTTPIKYRFRPDERKNISTIIAADKLKPKLYFYVNDLMKSVKNSAKRLITDESWSRLRNFKNRHNAD